MSLVLVVFQYIFNVSFLRPQRSSRKNDLSSHAMMHSDNYASPHRNYNSSILRHMYLCIPPGRFQSSSECRFTSLDKGKHIRPLISLNSSSEYALRLGPVGPSRHRMVRHLEDLRWCAHHPLANRKVAPPRPVFVQPTFLRSKFYSEETGPH